MNAFPPRVRFPPPGPARKRDSLPGDLTHAEQRLGRQHGEPRHSASWTWACHAAPHHRLDITPLALLAMHHNGMLTAGRASSLDTCPDTRRASGSSSRLELAYPYRLTQRSPWRILASRRQGSDAYPRQPATRPRPRAQLRTHSIPCNSALRHACPRSLI